MRSTHNFEAGYSALINSASLLQEIFFCFELYTEQFLELIFSPVYSYLYFHTARIWSPARDAQVKKRTGLSIYLMSKPLIFTTKSKNFEKKDTYVV